MTRIPEGLRRRLEREAKWHRRSMNAEIIDRLQKSFDNPDLISGIVDDISSEIDSVSYSLGEDIEKMVKSLDDMRRDIRAILACLPERASSGPSEDADEMPATKAEEAAQKAEQEARTKRALEEAVQTMERAGFKIARPDASETNDGEKK